MRLRLLIPAAVLVAGMFVSALACGGDDDGWHAFEKGPYSGDLGPGWLASYLTLEEGAAGDLPEDVPASVESLVGRFFEQETATHALLVFLDQDETYATNVNILGCEPLERSEAVSDLESLVAYYASFGVEAKRVDSVTFRGTLSPVIQIDLSPLAGDAGTTPVDTYQTYIKTGECYQAVTLTTRQGDTAQLAEYKRFIEGLEVDASQLAPADESTPAPRPTAGES